MKLEDYMEEYSRSLFSESSECFLALNYLKKHRCLEDNTIRLLGAGYCKENSKVPGKDINEINLNKNILGKIIIPIKSEFNDVVAFAARSPLPQEKGWWNQSFEKNNHLFMLNVSRDNILETSKVYIVEGYFDAIVLYQSGIKNICALMGTSLGHRRIGLLARYCENICLCYDADVKNQAGQIAQAKSIYELYQYGWNSISAMLLPLGVDPDEFVLKNGKEEFLKLEKKLSHNDVIKMSKKYKRYVNRI